MSFLFVSHIYIEIFKPLSLLYILSYLIASSEWKKITIIHRRIVDLDEISSKTGVTFTDQQKSKVTQHKVDMEKLCENEDVINTNVELFKDHDVTFCVLGIIYTHFLNK